MQSRLLQTPSLLLCACAREMHCRDASLDSVESSTLTTSDAQSRVTRRLVTRRQTVMRASLSCSLSSLGGGGGAGRGRPLSTALSTKHATSPSAIVPLSAAIWLALLEECNPDAS